MKSEGFGFFRKSKRILKSRLFLSVVLPTLLLSASARAETIGLVVTGGWSIAGHYTTDMKLECPNGYNPDTISSWKAIKFNSDAERDADWVGNHEGNFRTVEGGKRVHVGFAPQLVNETAPSFDAIGTMSEGLNLDGTADGKETDRTCKHNKLSSPDGASKDIDNQLYRSVGCFRGTRPEGVFFQYWNAEFETAAPDRWLIEIKGVDSRVNDTHVDVMVAHGLDKVVKDASGKFLPSLSQRVDTMIPRYVYYTTGRIENGVLITDPISDMRMPSTAITDTGEIGFQQARWRLKLTDTGAKGILGAYQDTDRFFRFMLKTAGNKPRATALAAAPFWHSLKRNADGMKDPKTGQCNSISAAWTVEMTNTKIVLDPILPPLPSRPTTVSSTEVEKVTRVSSAEK